MDVSALRESKKLVASLTMSNDSTSAALESLETSFRKVSTLIKSGISLLEPLLINVDESSSENWSNINVNLPFDLHSTSRNMQSSDSSESEEEGVENGPARLERLKPQPLSSTPNIAGLMVASNAMQGLVMSREVEPMIVRDVWTSAGKVVSTEKTSTTKIFATAKISEVVPDDISEVCHISEVSPHGHVDLLGLPISANTTEFSNSEDAIENVLLANTSILNQVEAPNMENDPASSFGDMSVSMDSTIPASKEDMKFAEMSMSIAGMSGAISGITDMTKPAVDDCCGERIFHCSLEEFDSRVSKTPGNLAFVEAHAKEFEKNWKTGASNLDLGRLEKTPPKLKGILKENPKSAVKIPRPKPRQVSPAPAPRLATNFLSKIAEKKPEKEEKVDYISYEELAKRYAHIYEEEVKNGDNIGKIFTFKKD